MKREDNELGHCMLTFGNAQSKPLSEKEVVICFVRLCQRQETNKINDRTCNGHRRQSGQHLDHRAGNVGSTMFTVSEITS